MLPVLFCLLTPAGTGFARELGKEDEVFLRENAPRLMEMIEEARRLSYEDVLEEAGERVDDLRAEWKEARGDGVAWARGKRRVDGWLRGGGWGFCNVVASIHHSVHLVYSHNQTSQQTIQQYYDAGS